MSRTRRELSGEEKKLWRRVAAGVKPRRPRADEPVDEPQPPRISHQAAKRTPVASASPAKPRKHDAPLQDRVGEKRVRRGKLV
ncbi:MAG: hypothetical protein ACREH4_07110, partial [Vitreimonas sp.]